MTSYYVIIGLLAVANIGITAALAFMGRDPEDKGDTPKL